MSKETLDFIEGLYDKEKADAPTLDYVSFVAGAQAIINHLMDKL